MLVSWAEIDIAEPSRAPIRVDSMVSVVPLGYWDDIIRKDAVAVGIVEVGEFRDTNGCANETYTEPLSRTTYSTPKVRAVVEPCVSERVETWCSRADV